MIQIKFTNPVVEVAIADALKEKTITWLISGVNSFAFQSSRKNDLLTFLKSRGLIEGRDFHLTTMYDTPIQITDKTSERVHAILTRMDDQTNPVSAIVFKNPPVVHGEGVKLRELRLFPNGIMYFIWWPLDMEMYHELKGLNSIRTSWQKISQRYPDVFEKCLDYIENALQERQRKTDDSETLNY